MFGGMVPEIKPTKGKCMSDVECPYCKAGNEINHDDGYGCEEDERYEQACNNCDKAFNFTTAISFDYNVFCQDGHNLDGGTPVKDSIVIYCDDCDYVEVVFK